MDAEEVASKFLAGVPAVFWHYVPVAQFLVAWELPGIQGTEKLKSALPARAYF